MSSKRLTKDLINKFSVPNEAKNLSSGIFQNYLLFIPAKKYIKYFSGTTWIDSWKFNGISEENIENKTKSESNFAPNFVDHHLLPDINLNRDCLINSISIPKKVINLYIPYALSPKKFDIKNLNTDFTLCNCLLRMLTKNADPDKYVYTIYGTEFDLRSEFSLSDDSMGKTFIIFGGDMSSPVHVDNKEKYILILGEGPTQGLYDTTLTAESIYPINLTQSGRRFVSSLRYNGGDSFLFVNTVEIYQFKAKDSEIKDYALCLGNTSKDFTINNMKKKQD